MPAARHRPADAAPAAQQRLARLGGDEFGLILFDCRLEQAKSLMQQVVNQISQHPFYWEGKIYRVGASAGITRIGGDAKSSELLAQADIACYTAKHHGRGQVYLYETRQNSCWNGSMNC